MINSSGSYTKLVQGQLRRTEEATWRVVVREGRTKARWRLYEGWEASYGAKETPIFVFKIFWAIWALNFWARVVGFRIGLL
ncbi:hypothetical protein ES332_A04G115200v1 [Gossypium tomentosum]|uniref:Uncharacterized protein n=1 Tax=Gossypium tomentosum TaxID=34277 RepID=A0A5D2QXM3_GOSTO|nr:hypothetical protein ES332_A04G115200v1 [Gossypium tomentosum]